MSRDYHYWSRSLKHWQWNPPAGSSQAIPKPISADLTTLIDAAQLIALQASRQTIREQPKLWAWHTVPVAHTANVITIGVDLTCPTHVHVRVEKAESAQGLSLRGLPVAATVDSIRKSFHIFRSETQPPAQALYAVAEALRLMDPAHLVRDLKRAEIRHFGRLAPRHEVEHRTPRN